MKTIPYVKLGDNQALVTHPPCDTRTNMLYAANLQANAGNNSRMYVTCNCDHKNCILDILTNLPDEATLIHPLQGGDYLFVDRTNFRIDCKRQKPSAKIPEHLRQATACEKCMDIDFPALQAEDGFRHHNSLEALFQSAAFCPFCFMMSELPALEGRVVFDSTRHITLKKPPGSQKSITVSFPTTETEYEAWVCSRESELFLFTENTTNTTFPCFITGRAVQGSSETQQIIMWLHYCQENHKLCNNAHSAMVRAEAQALETIPKRLLKVGSTSNDQPVKLVENSSDNRFPYLTLSYQWGEHLGYPTTQTSNYEAYLNFIDVGTLCPIFQDGIEITRQLGFQYLWIDALCIIQDSYDDRSTQISEMASIYEGSAMTLSASVSTSSQSRLRQDLLEFNEVKFAYQDATGATIGDFWITDRVLNDFTTDVTLGTLSERAWCFQERILSRRILHFGPQQLYFEFLTEVLEEASTEPCELKDDEVGSFRKSFHEWRVNQAVDPQEQQSNEDDFVPHVDFVGLGRNEPPLKEIHSREPHGKWYECVEQFSRRQMKYSTDKLPAIGGIAQRFSERLSSKDCYVAGLWARDLPLGLLWQSPLRHEGGGRFMRDALNRLIEARAPSWSWASVDGEIVWPQDPVGFVFTRVKTLQVHLRGPNKYGEVVNGGYLHLQGPAVLLRELWGFRVEERGLLRRAAAKFQQNWPDNIPSACFDSMHVPEVTIDCDASGVGDDVYVLLINLNGCGREACTHYQGCERLLGNAIIIQKQDRERLIFERVGIAKVWAQQFVRLEQQEVYLV